MGKRVGIIGTGSSGIQSTPVVARTAAHLTVFQRTPQYSVPAGNCPTDPALVAEARANWSRFRDVMLSTPIGAPEVPSTIRACEHTPAGARDLQAAWQKGGLGPILVSTYCDITDRQSNEWLAEFVREKIRQTVKDPETARKLMPSYLIATKRPVMDEGYYETFNRANVSLVDLREDPLVEITPDGVRTASAHHPLDMLIYATGFDAITGALQKINPRGRGGVPLTERWAERFNSWLGLTIPGMPNLFMIHGPESPCVLYNMPLGAERQTDWIRDCILHLRQHGIGTIEPAPGVDLQWSREVESSPTCRSIRRPNPGTPAATSPASTASSPCTSVARPITSASAKRSAATKASSPNPRARRQPERGGSVWAARRRAVLAASLRHWRRAFSRRVLRMSGTRATRIRLDTRGH